MGSERIEYGHNSAGEQSGLAMNPGSCYDVQIEEQEFTEDEMNVFLLSLSRKSTDSEAEA